MNQALGISNPSHYDRSSVQFGESSEVSILEPCNVLDTDDSAPFPKISKAHTEDKQVSQHQSSIIIDVIIEVKLKINWDMSNSSFLELRRFHREGKS